ncbi:MAG: mandelate racemase/muconate lactonizing enzyme family protein [Candidatus Thermoplasmatota archaeon]|nr:mandelate racemase/muconate lactonizing enzyme family protein [Candidatus Thermoplasmatota archaeon]
MKDFKIEVIKAGIPLDSTTPPQKWKGQWSFQVYAKARSGGKTGWGETLPAALNSVETYSSIMNAYLKVVEGTDHRDIRGIWEKMARASFSGGYGVTNGAMSAIDIALWDLKARELETSLSSLLGGTSGRARRYASLARYETTDDALRVVKGLVEEGFTMIKIHQSTGDTIDTMKLIRKEIGYDVKIAVDLNCAFNFNQARGFIEKIVKYEPFWIEEPLWPHDDYDGLARLNRIAPLAGGENEISTNQFLTMLQKESLSYYQPDVGKIGGITPMLDLVALFKAYNAGIAFHSRPHNGWVSTIASACVAIGTGTDAWIETPPSGIPDQYFDHSVTMDSDKVVPNGPGISLSPREPVPVPGPFAPLVFHGEKK